MKTNAIGWTKMKYNNGINHKKYKQNEITVFNNKTEITEAVNDALKSSCASFKLFTNSANRRT